MTTRRAQRLSRRDRIRDRRDYQRVSREGMRVTTQCFLVLVAPTYPPDDSAATRLGITVSKRVGGAVERASVKRRVREWFRRHRAELPIGRDVVVIARSGAAELTQAAVSEQLSNATHRIREKARAVRSGSS